MLDINIVDDSFQLKLTPTYHLSIQTGANGLSYTILDLSKLRYVVLKHYPFDGLKNENEISDYLSVVYKEDNLLNREYKNISHLFIGEKSTLVPSVDFDAQNTEKYVQFLYNDFKNEVAVSNEIPVLSCHNIFTYPNLLLNNLNTKFKGVKLYHHTTSFVSTLIKASGKTATKICMVYLGQDILNIGIAKSGKLLFFNTFKYKDKADIAYFILSVLEQYSIPPKLADIYFSADINGNDDYFGFLNNYLGHIRFINPSGDFSYSLLFDERYLTRFVNLFNLALCE